MLDPFGKWLLSQRLDAVKPWIHGTLLDVGCGTNQLVRSYPGDGVGVDIYPWPGVDVMVGDSSRLPFPAETFDTVTVIAALNHIPNREAVLLEIRRVIRTTGRLILTMIPPGIGRIWHFLRQPWDVDQHQRGMKRGERYGLSHEEISRLLKATGFEVDEERLFCFGFNRVTLAKPKVLIR